MLGREHFDALMLNAAATAGAALWQPWTLTEVKKTATGFVGTAVAQDKRETVELRARIVIAAHGSWEPGMLPTQIPDGPPRASDLFAFKARFLDCGLPAGLMPLLVFPGGYGGMIHSDGGRVSLSCCIRRDDLARCRGCRGSAETRSRPADARRVLERQGAAAERVAAFRSRLIYERCKATCTAFSVPMTTRFRPPLLAW